MSGIAGCWYRNGRTVRDETLGGMAAALAHRGPDGNGIWKRASVGFAHSMLWSTPEATQEHLPCVDVSGNFAITADARIDNRDDLYAAIGLRSEPLSSLSDSQLILHAYIKWGEACPRHLLGDFAFVIWDDLWKTLFCARDHFGVRPFTYFQSRDLFAFASEPKALFCLPEIQRLPNEERLADFLVQDLEGIDHTSTFYKGIKRLPPASALSIHAERDSLSEYWSLDRNRETSFATDRDYVEGFSDLFDRAVACRLRSHLPVGSMLSGGLDSSSIVAVARRQMQAAGRPPPVTFSGMTNDPDCVETRHIKAMLAGHDDAFCEIITAARIKSLGIDPGQLARNTDNLFGCGMSSIPTFVYSAANQRGINVMLDGVDGDLVLSRAKVNVSHLWKSGQRKAALQEAIGARRFYGQAAPRIGGALTVAQLATYAHAPEAIKSVVRRYRDYKWVQRAVAGSLIQPQFAESIQLGQRFAALAKRSRAPGQTTLRESHVKVLKHPYLAAALERYDWLAAAFSIEPRHPLLDVRLVEYALALPWHLKDRNGWGKYVLRTAMNGVLPLEVQWRRGCNALGPHFARAWLDAEGDYVINRVRQGCNGILARRYLDPGSVERALGHSNSPGGQICYFQVWEAFSLIEWLNAQTSTE